MSSGNKLILSVIGLSLLIIFAGAFLVTKMTNHPQLTSDQQVSLSVEETSHDWGEIPITGGNVTKTFTIKNNGQGVLNLANVSTSCMCTTAQVTINGQPSPFFGMHSKSSWLGQVPPGGKAELTVEYDPAYHGPNAVGQISRQVSLETNDPDNPKITFNLTANVIK